MAKAKEVKAEATENVADAVVAEAATEAKEEKPAKAKKATKAAKTEETSAEEKAEKRPAAKKKSNHKWYVLQARSNYEKRVQASIREQVMMQGLEKDVEEVLIPMEEVIEVKKGQKKRSEKKFFPGYVLVKANLTDKVWHLLKTTTHVIAFVGSTNGQRPLPISEKEAAHMLHQMEAGVEKPRSLVTYEVGEEVRVVDGPFNTFQGIVEEVDEEKNRLKVSVSIFGRATPIDLDFVQVEKA
jgi:transcriptional antiterminator NusG